MSIIDFDSAWFRAYADVKLESDSQALPFYLKAALDATAEALTQQDLEDDERKAILVAIEDLYSMHRKKPSSLPNATRGVSRTAATTNRSRRPA
jgi:hypothetical protein